MVKRHIFGSLRLTSQKLNIALMAILLGATLHALDQIPEHADLESGVAQPEFESVAPRFERVNRFWWDHEKGGEGDVKIVVNLARQVLVVMRGSHEIAWSRISTGKSGNETHAGDFKILQKKRDHMSSIYRAADMPYMQRITPDGIAIHGGIVPRLPASQGCIRVPYAFARFLYSVTDIGSDVLIR